MGLVVTAHSAIKKLLMVGVRQIGEVKMSTKSSNKDHSWWKRIKNNNVKAKKLWGSFSLMQGEAEIILCITYALTPYA
jgi:hypothetical protein